MPTGYAHRHGELNPIRKAKGTSPNKDSNTINAMRESQNMSSAQNRPNAYKGQRALKGEVLYAFRGADNTVYVKARIPEVTFAPSPTSLPTANDPGDETADWGAINLFPTFVALNFDVSNKGLPSPRTVVYLDFEHRLTLEGPVYLGPVEGQA